ncbi:MAG: hypothetical protein LBK06_06065, partial [Planctomycetaceae bacterium]|nr:hypothetical protein [Planctomycetaceae bacterium]
MLISYLLGQNANAKTYHIGTSGQTDYATLDELRNNVTVWYDGDEIILHNDDSSLAERYGFNNFDGKSITISGNAKISPSTNNVQFLSSFFAFLTIADGSSITWNGFNLTSGNGGAIYGDNATISGTSTFSNNVAYNGGAIYSNGEVTISCTSTFSNNVTYNDGGAIYSVGDVTIFGTSIFSNNKTSWSGGAIYSSSGDVTISGTSTFTENTTANYGGAIRSGNVTISGTGTFSNNSAGSYGGAIYVYNNLNITASTGDIVFEGNKANNSPNAIFMHNSNNNKTLSLTATDGNKVEFYDPISSTSSIDRTDLIIDINKGGQTGTVLFDMSKNTVDPSHKVSNIRGNTTVYNGTLALKGEAVYGAVNNAGYFTLQNNATLLVIGKNNKINSSGNVILRRTLAFDLTGVTPITDTALTFNGNTSGTAIGKVDIRVFNGAGTFNLAKATNSTFDITGTDLTTHGELISGTRVTSPTLALADSSKTLQLTLSNVTNGTVTWNTTSGDWNATSDNWTGTIGSPVTKFLHGDDVIFNASGDHQIKIQDGGVTIGDMMKIGGNGTWTFTGGEIEDGTIIVAYNANANTKIYFDTRQMNQRIEVDVNTTTTIAATQGKTLTFKGLSNDYGGAIYAELSSNLTIGEEGSSVIFDANSTISGNGGAIYSRSDVTISGTSTFTDNTANSSGGAIYSRGNVKIIASTGDIVFSGNKASGTPNAIYMQNYGNNKTLSLAAKSGHSVLLYDPIENLGTLDGININNNNGEEYKGTVLFDKYQSNISGNTTVYDGTLALQGGAVYGVDTNSSDFTLQNNATLLTTGSGNKINATGNVTLDGTLAFDLTGYNSTAALTLNGTIIGSPTIDIKSGFSNGTYILASGTNFTSMLPLTFTIDGTSVANTRADGKILTSNTVNNLVLWVSTTNGNVTWNGSNSNWNITDRNWAGTIDGNNVYQFLHNDNVTFGTSSQKNITVDSGDVTVTTMTVNENGYTFNGGKISGTSLNITATTGETIFQNEIDFSNGINVAQNNTFTFDYTAEKNNTNTFSGDGTLKKTGTEKLILSANNALTGNLNLQLNNGELELTGSNNFNGNIDLETTTSTLTVNSAANSTFNGTIAGNGNLKKEGTGTLTLTKNYSATGNLAVNAGTLLLDPTTAGDISFNNQLSGNGTLAVDLVNTTDIFTLGTNTGTAFAGILEMRKGTFATSGFTYLQNAELKLNAGSNIK